MVRRRLTEDKIKGKISSIQGSNYGNAFEGAHCSHKDYCFNPMNKSLLLSLLIVSYITAEWAGMIMNIGCLKAEMNIGHDSLERMGRRDQQML